MEAIHVRASDLLGHSPQPGDETGKAVGNMAANQAEIVRSLARFEVHGRPVLLDGHYAILDLSGAPVPVPISVFEAIHPIAMILVVGDPSEILTRVHSRGEHGFDLNLISRLMNAEQDQADIVSAHLNIPLMKWQPTSGTDAALSFFRQCAPTR